MQRDEIVLAEIVSALERVIELTSGRTSAELAGDPDRRDALLWNYTVLGEAIGQLSKDLKASHGAISWADPVRLRNRVVHGYWSVDLDVLVATARNARPGFLASVRGVQAALPPEPES